MRMMFGAIGGMKFRAELKNMWINTSTPPYAFMA
jgi:hypothetical protein